MKPTFAFAVIIITMIISITVIAIIPYFKG
jgi:hypothetical protein